MINHTLWRFTDIYVIAYIDNILIYSKTLREYKEHVH